MNIEPVLGIGSVVVDHVVELARFPQPDTKTAIEAHWRQVGGPVPVALATAAHFGAPATFVGRWGDDDAGRFIGESLRRRGVEIGPSRSDPEWESGFAQVWTERETGRRTIAYARGSCPLPLPDEIDDALIARHRWLHLDGWAGDAALSAAERMRAKGGTVVLDAGSKKPGMERLLAHVDILVASALFRRSWFGASEVSHEQLRELGVDRVIATDGEEGATVLTPDETTRQPAARVDAIDTNGAGDVFCGALIARLSAGDSMPLAVRFATAAAGLACQVRGNEHGADVATVNAIATQLPASIPSSDAFD